MADGGGSAILLGGQGDEHTVVSNAIHYAGTSSSFNCFELGLPFAAYSAIDHNLCFAPAAPGAEWADGYGSLPAWVATSGFDLSSATDDPGFADPQAGDLAAATATAAMVDSGHPSLSCPVEIGGFPRDLAPDAGAHEWGVDGIFGDGFESGDTEVWALTVF